MVETKQTVFHGGVQYLERLDELFRALDYVTIKRESEGNKKELSLLWSNNYSILNTLYKELYPKMSEEQRKEFRDAHQILKKEYTKQRKDFINNTKCNLTFLEMFDEFEIQLRNIAEIKGLTMPDKRDMLDAAEL